MDSEPDTPRAKQHPAPITGRILVATLAGAYFGPCLYLYIYHPITHGPVIAVRSAGLSLFGGLLGLTVGVVIVVVIRRMRLPLAFFFELMLSAVVVSLLFLNVRWAEKQLEESNERFRAWVEQKDQEFMEQQQPADSK
jgi:prolipoprotein diacylglyceryltransferase